MGIYTRQWHMLLNVQSALEVYVPILKQLWFTVYRAAAFCNDGLFQVFLYVSCLGKMPIVKGTYNTHFIRYLTQVHQLALRYADLYWSILDQQFIDLQSPAFTEFFFLHCVSY